MPIPVIERDYFSGGRRLTEDPDAQPELADLIITLQTAANATENALGGLDTDQVANASGVAGASCSAALDQLDTDAGAAAAAAAAAQGDATAALGQIGGLDTVVAIKKRLVHTDGNRVDVYVADGSTERPYKTIAAAIAVAVSTDVIKVAAKAGGYAEDFVLPSGVSLEGYGSNQTIIAGSVATGAAPCSLRGFTFTGVAKTLTFNGPCSVADCFSYNQTILGNGVVQGWNFHIITTGVTALVLNHANALFQGVLSTISATGDVPTILGTTGAAILDLVKVLGSRAAGPVIESVVGSIQLLNVMVVNAGGGAAISADNGAGAGNPNILHGVFTAGATAFGTAVALVDNVTGGAVTGSAVVYNPGAFVAAGAVGVVWAAAKPATRTDAIDRIAAALATHLGAPIA